VAFLQGILFEVSIKDFLILWIRNKGFVTLLMVEAKNTRNVMNHNKKALNPIANRNLISILLFNFLHNMIMRVAIVLLTLMTLLMNKKILSLE
jgi:hypothetical protein